MWTRGWSAPWICELFPSLYITAQHFDLSQVLKGLCVAACLFLSVGGCECLWGLWGGAMSGSGRIWWNRGIKGWRGARWRAWRPEEVQINLPQFTGPFSATRTLFAFRIRLSTHLSVYFRIILEITTISGHVCSDIKGKPTIEHQVDNFNETRPQIMTANPQISSICILDFLMPITTELDGKWEKK